MSEGKSLIDLSNLSQPATRLIEKISDAIGVMYEPTRIIKLAQAEAHAALIGFNSKSTITELEQRAINSLIKKEAKKQRNIESITAKAIGSLPNSAKPENIEEDWLSYFFSKCETISNESMQRVWAEVLARQASASSSFSRKTLSILSTLESYDAESFVKFCSCVIIHNAHPETHIYNIDDEFYRDKDIYLGRALQLQSLGLLHFNNESLYFSVDGSKTIEFDDEIYYKVELQYFNQNYELLIPENESQGILNDKPTFEYGCISLTAADVELFQICNPSPIDGFMEKVGARLRKADQILKQVI